LRRSERLAAGGASSGTIPGRRSLLSKATQEVTKGGPPAWNRGSCDITRRVRHRAMIWVWILPALLLCYAVVAIPTLTPHITSSLLWSGTSQSWLTHYFGWGCRMTDRCFDQVLITQPFYTATAYAIGARLA